MLVFMHVYSLQKYYKIMTERIFLGEKDHKNNHKYVILTKSKQAQKTKCYLTFTLGLLIVNLKNGLFSFRFIAIKLFAIAFCINNRHFSVCKKLSLLNFKTILYIRKN